MQALRNIASPMALAHLATHIEAIAPTAGERETVIEMLDRLREAGILTRAEAIDHISLADGESAPAAAAAPKGPAAGETRVVEGPLVSVVIPCRNAGPMLPQVSPDS